MCGTGDPLGKTAMLSVIEGAPVNRRAHYKVKFASHRAWAADLESDARLLGSENAKFGEKDRKLLLIQPGPDKPFDI